MMYVGFPISLRNVEDLLHERGLKINHETVRFRWNRFGTLLAVERMSDRALNNMTGKGLANLLNSGGFGTRENGRQWPADDLQKFTIVL